MGKGANQTQRVDIIDSYDPRSTGRAAQKGTFFRYIPSVGSPVLLIKTDDGFSINWSPIGGGSPSITPVSAASVANVNIASAPATIDGVAYTTVLLKDQTAPEENGVYDYNGLAVPLTRNSDWDTAGEFTVGRQVFVAGGTTYTDTLWANDLAVVTLGTDPIQFSSIPATAFMLKDFSNALPSVANITFSADNTFDVGGAINGLKNLFVSFINITASAAKYWTTGPAIIFSNAFSALIQTDDAASGAVATSALNIGTGAQQAAGSSQVTGEVEIFTGDNYGHGASGQIGLFTGYNYNDNNSGRITHETGHANGSGGTSGQIRLVTGSGTNTGDIILELGVAAATQGTIKLVDPANPPIIGFIFTATNVNGAGKWQTPALSPMIKVQSGSYAVNAATDFTIIFTSTTVGANVIQLPAGVDGLQFRIVVDGSGGQAYTLTPNGGNLLDIGITSFIGPAISQIIQFKGNTWYLVG